MSELLIGGQLRGAAGLSTQEIHNPADGSLVGVAPIADAAAVEDAVQAADAAFGGWSGLPPAQRAGYLLALADWVQGHTDRLAALLTGEQGKPTSEARSEVAAAAKAFRYYAAEATRVFGETIPTESATLRSHVLLQPVGVVAAIVTWNYPLGMATWKIAPALAAGCTVVLKPAEVTPLSTLELARAAVEIGLPPGVLNIVNGPGDTVGEQLATHPLIRHVSFTGGTGTGRRLLALAAEGIKRVTLELGGGSPLIVAADAPLELAVADGVKRAFRNAGQLCNSVQQVLVDRRVAAEFTDRFVAKAAAMVLGRGDADPEPDLGPMTSAAALAHVEEHVADAAGSGAAVLTGGQRTGAGLFYPPTVLADTTPQMLVRRAETFGPVAPIVPVDDLEEAFYAANAGETGLVAYLYTTDLRLAHLGAERLQYGTVNINNVGGGDVPFPYAGWKQSGLGIELGPHGLRQFLETKHVRIELGY